MQTQVKNARQRVCDVAPNSSLRIDGRCNLSDVDQTDALAQQRMHNASSSNALAHHVRCSIRPQHVLSHFREAIREAHSRPCGERYSHTASLLESPRSQLVVAQWMQLWAIKNLRLAFPKPWSQAVVIGSDKKEGLQNKANAPYTARLPAQWSQLK